MSDKLDYRTRMETSIGLLHRQDDYVLKPMRHKLAAELAMVQSQIADAEEERRYLQTLVVLELPEMCKFLEEELETTRKRKTELEQSPCGGCGKLIGAHTPKMIKKCLARYG